MNDDRDYRDEKEENYVYKNVIEDSKNSRIWSAVSVGIGALSIILCFIPIVGIIFGFASVAFSVISRRMIGYFENLAIGGLIVGIFGTVFGIAYAVFDFLLKNTDFLSELF